MKVSELQFFLDDGRALNYVFLDRNFHHFPNEHIQKFQVIYRSLPNLVRELGLMTGLLVPCEENT
ncbi:MAG: hypothetical protein K0Q87_5092 [Neobacillus sp.]|jgi:hypothetical protein|nr:hypothetical protein [Neobacillus sp.]